MRTKPLIVAMGLLVLCASVAFAATKHSVTAHVVSGTGDIKAELQPVEFTIPAGTTGTVTKFHWSDPSSGSSSDKLGVGGSIYSITQKKSWKDQDGNPIFQLPPGEYRFTAGGSPGAYATLTYQVE